MLNTSVVLPPMPASLHRLLFILQNWSTVVIKMRKVVAFLCLWEPLVPFLSLWTWTVLGNSNKWAHAVFVFCDQPFSFHIMASRLTHLAACVRIPFSLKAECCPIVQYSPAYLFTISRHLGWFHLWLQWTWVCKYFFEPLLLGCDDVMHKPEEQSFCPQSLCKSWMQ